MKQKSFIIGVGIFILGGVVGGLVFTRHYGVGPLAKLQSVPTSANSPSEVCNGLFDNYSQYYDHFHAGDKGYNANTLDVLRINYWNCVFIANGRGPYSDYPQNQ